MPETYRVHIKWVTLCGAWHTWSTVASHGLLALVALSPTPIPGQLSQLGLCVSDFSLVVTTRVNEASLIHCLPLNHHAKISSGNVLPCAHPVWSNVSCWGGHRVHEGPWDVTSLGMAHTWTEFGLDILCQGKQKPFQKWKTKNPRSREPFPRPQWVAGGM